MTFERMSEANRPRFVADQILTSIRDGSLTPGERLPSEAKLAELTGVGRTSVREALAALRLMGVVETRVGDGTYVRASADAAMVSNGITQAIEQSEEALQLQEARAVFETGLVRLVCIRWNRDKARVFDRLIDQMAAAAAQEQYEEYIRLHREFHLALAQATDNSIVAQTEKQFLEYMDHEGWQDMERQAYLPNRGEYLQQSLDEHRAIVSAVAAGNGQAASDLMHDHFSRHENGTAHGEAEHG